MRTFIAVEIGDEPKKALSTLIDHFKDRFPNAKWIRPENIHITLRFLGEIDEKVLPDICSAVKKTAASSQLFFLNLGSPGSFGGKSPRIMFLNLAGEVDKLVKMQAELEDNLENSGFGRDTRPFKSHITLGRRKRSDIPSSWSDFTIKVNTEFSVKEIVLFESELTRSGPIYTSLARYKLDHL